MHRVGGFNLIPSWASWSSLGITWLPVLQIKPTTCIQGTERSLEVSHGHLPLRHSLGLHLSVSAPASPREVQGVYQISSWPKAVSDLRCLGCTATGCMENIEIGEPNAAVNSIQIYMVKPRNIRYTFFWMQLFMLSKPFETPNISNSRDTGAGLWLDLCTVVGKCPTCFKKRSIHGPWT